MVKKLKVIDLFAGAGGFSTGFESTDLFKVIYANEYIDKFCQTYIQNHKDTEVQCKDIRQVKLDEVKKLIDNQTVDVIIGGPPCQGYSMAGRRDKKDPRNSLFMDFVRFVKYFERKYFVMENVGGILTMKNANNELVKNIIMEEFKKIGYNVEYKKLLASNYGVPQNRRRVFFIGTKRKQEIIFPEPTHNKTNRVAVKTVLFDKNDVDKSFFHSQKMIDGFVRRKAANKAKGYGFGAQYLRLDEPSFTISARYGKDGSDALVKYSDTEVRMLTMREAARIQTFPDTYEFVGSKKDVYMQIGNAVPCLLAKHIALSIKKMYNDYLKEQDTN